MKKLSILFIMLGLGSAVGFGQAPKIRVAVVGLDHDHVWGKLRNFMNGVYLDAELVAVADPHPELIEKARKMVLPGVKFFSDYTQMLDEIKPDAVLVTTANNLHLPILRACAQRHIHFLTEKAMASSGADAREMERLAREAGIKLMVNYSMVFLPASQEAYRRMRADELGPVQKMVIAFGNGGPKDGNSSPEFIAWLYDTKKNGAGALMDFACYGADWAMWVKGRPERVFAYSLKLKVSQHNEVEDDAVVLLEYPDATAVLLPSWDWPYSRTQSEFYGPKGSLIVTGDSVFFHAKGVRTTADQPLGQKLDPAPLPPEMSDGTAYFLECIRNNKPIEGPASAEVSVGVNEIIDAALESIRTGKATILRP